MAKRRKEKDEEEDKPFKIPKFDKEKFIKKEKRNIKSTFIAFLFGAFMAFICFGFWVLMGQETGLRWPLVVLVAIASASFVKYIYMRIDLDTSHFTKKNWFSSYAIYFFSWLIIFIVLVNPPIYDSENPKIDFVVLPDSQELGSFVKFCAKVTDNSELKKSDIAFSIDGSVLAPSEYNFTDDVFTYTFENNDTQKSYSYSLKATDSSGNTEIREGTFEYSNQSIYIPDPLGVTTPPGPIVGSATSIKFKIKDNVDRVYYTITDANNNTGEPINVTQKEGDYYITYPKYEGWVKDQNVTMKVYAEQIHYFPLVSSTQYCIPEPSDICNNTIVDSQTYYFQVADETGVASEKPPEVKLPSPECKGVPGFEMIIFIVSLTAVVLILKYKKRNKK